MAHDNQKTVSAGFYGPYCWVILPLLGVLIWLTLNYFLPAIVPQRAPAADLFLAASVKDLKPEPLESAGYIFILLFVPFAYLAALLASGRLNLEKLKPQLVLAAVSVQAAVSYIAAQNVLCQNIYVRRYFKAATEFPAIFTAVMIFAVIAVFAVLYNRDKNIFSALTKKRQNILVLKFAKIFTALIGVWVLFFGLLSSVFTNRNVGDAYINVLVHLPYTMGEFAAVMNGRSPGVDFFPQYQYLLGYLFWPYFKIFDVTITSYTIAMASLSALGLALVWRVLVKVSGSLLAGTVLLTAAVGIGFYAPSLSEFQRFYAFNYYAVAPVRYLSVWVILFLLMRYLEKRTSAGLYVLFGAAGLFAVNNADFGIPALVAAFTACLLPADKGYVETPRGILRVASAAAGGLAAALLVFVLLSFMHSGQLPDFAAMTQYQRIFAVNGFMTMPMPPLGLHWLVLFTFLSALVAGCVPSEENRTLRGLLIFSGVAGCGIGMYYVGRSHSTVLNALFPAWGISLALLIITTVRSLFRATPVYAKSVYVLPLLWMFYFAALSFQVNFTLNKPYSQYERFMIPTDTGYAASVAGLARFVASYTTPGETVMIINSHAHVLGLLAGVNNVFPYAHRGSLILKAQVGQVMDIADRRHVYKIFGAVPPELETKMYEAGYVKAGGIASVGFWVWERPGA